MNTFYPLALSLLDVFDKILLTIVLLMISTISIRFIQKELQRKKNNQMIKSYLSIKNEKHSEIMAVLTNPKNITALELKNNIQIDLTKFDKRYKDIFKEELNKIQKTHQVNPWNLQLLLRILG